MKVLTEKIIREICKEDQSLALCNFPYESEKKGNVIPLGGERYRLRTKLNVMRIDETISIQGNRIECLMFPTPTLIKDETRDEVIKFINWMNRVTKGLGHFYVDECNDLAYIVVLTEEMLRANIDEIKENISKIPLNYFRDMEKAFIKLIFKEWNSEKAIRYMDEMYTNGYVDNSEYDE